ncbi:hypothetical protein LPJ66_000707 [Kickxella alabastrina]|uniref:Uncharacterized protein n=1 Tax=Kickxella alabastrina TaxID=61397 RepID=A0ACC1IVC6_9FUNG|nr:hypothetical protein LPJ66_000707 [Kickxella alabastrina]
MPKGKEAAVHTPSSPSTPSLPTDVPSLTSLLSQYKGHKEEYSSLQTLLTDLPSELTYEAMVPVGPLAFFPGQLIHTNEILVLLGDNWFVDRSASQAAAMARRREEYADAQISLIKKRIKVIKDEKAEDLGGLPFGKELEGNLYNEQGERFVEIKEELEEGVEVPFSQGDGLEEPGPVVNAGVAADLEAKRLRAIEEAGAVADIDRQNLGLEEQRILDILDQFNSDDDLEDDDDEDTEEDEDEEEGDEFSEEDRANAAQDDDEDDFNDHTRNGSNSDDDEPSELKSKVIERFVEAPPRNSPKGILKAPVSLFKSKRAEDTAARESSARSVSFNPEAVAYSLPQGDSSPVDAVAGLLAEMAVSEDKKKQSNLLFKPNTGLSGVRFPSSSSTIKGGNKTPGASDVPKKQQQNQPMKTAVVERETTAEPTTETVDEEMHAKEIAQAYNRMRFAKISGGKLEGAAEVAEQVLATMAGVILVDKRGEDGEMNKQEFERIELPSDPSPYAMMNRNQSPPEVARAPKPVRTPVVESVKESVEESVAPTAAAAAPGSQQAKPKMSRFKAQRLGLEN